MVVIERNILGQRKKRAAATFGRAGCGGRRAFGIKSLAGFLCTQLDELLAGTLRSMFGLGWAGDGDIGKCANMWGMEDDNANPGI
jgi:hypothetical protein